MRALLVFSALLAIAAPSSAQDFSFAEFVGEWAGIISSDLTFGYEDAITLVVEEDGYYTDSSGHLMPDLYPDTQVCTYDPVTNRVQFRYLHAVYAGQYFYQSIYFEVVSYTGNTVEMHYNFWDDPEPHPDVQTLYLVRAGTTAAPDDLTVADLLGLSNYPNPFNPRTTVAFELPRDAAVTLTVQDLRGRRVATLAEGTLAAGRHEFPWDATGLPAGTYLYTLNAGGEVRTGRMTLVK